MAKKKRGTSPDDLYLAGPQKLCSEITFEIIRGKKTITKDLFVLMTDEEIKAVERYWGLYKDADLEKVIAENEKLETEENRNPLGLTAIKPNQTDIVAATFIRNLTVPDEDEDLMKGAKNDKDSKVCPKCMVRVGLSYFVINKKETLSYPYLGRDLICGKCLANIKSLRELKQYLWTCNREFNNELWVICKSGNASEEKAIEKYIKQYNTDKYYIYKDHGNLPYPKTNDPDDRWYIPEYLSHEKSYNFDWQMTLDDYELKYLTEYISRLSKDKDLSDTISMDMAMKMAKLSLAANQAWENYRQGQCTLKDAQAIQDMFEQQSKTANLAPAKNGAGNNSAGSFSEISQYLENNCAALMTKVSYEKDDIDEIIEIFRNTIKATADNM